MARGDLKVVMASQETQALPGSLSQIYLGHHDRLFRAAYRITGSSSDAEDVVQTVFLRLAIREEATESADNLSAYLYRAAINSALDLLRARREGKLVPLDQAQCHAADDDSSPVEDHGLRSWLRQALAQLSPRWAEMFVLKHVEGCNNGEIARLCGTSQAVVAVTLFRARARLKSELAAQLGGTP
jgi:RNA polymerase sigma-70 factor (ECF subfamily)